MIWVSPKTLDLINNIECDLLRFDVLLPSDKFIWSKILEKVLALM
jgi:hypothetical protein